MSVVKRMMLTLGLSLLGLWSIASAIQFLELRAEMSRTLDQRLAASARMVAGLMNQVPPSVPPLAADKVLSSLVVQGAANIACQVSSLRGEVIARTRNAPQLENVPSTGFADQEHGGELWRVYTFADGPVIVTTADRMAERDQLLANVTRAAVLPFAIATVGGLLALWFGIVRSLRPLTRLRHAIAARAPDSLTPLTFERLPRELQPLVAATNELLARVREAMDRERRFTSDAAHELRTPLTAIKVHLDVARLHAKEQQQAAEVTTALRAAGQGVLRLQRTLEQLLMLARLDSGSEMLPEARADVAEVVRHAVEAASTVSDGEVRVSLAATPLTVSAPAELASGALRNLLDNALRASPPGQPVELDVSADGNAVRFSVRDHGPGITDKDLAEMKDRFWSKATGAGSGLGLAIVDAFAQHANGRLELSRPDSRGGLLAVLTLPAAGD